MAKNETTAQKAKRRERAAFIKGVRLVAEGIIEQLEDMVKEAKDDLTLLLNAPPDLLASIDAELAK